MKARDLPRCGGTALLLQHPEQPEGRRNLCFDNRPSGLDGLSRDDLGPRLTPKQGLPCSGDRPCTRAVLWNAATGLGSATCLSQRLARDQVS